MTRTIYIQGNPLARVTGTFYFWRNNSGSGHSMRQGKIRQWVQPSEYEMLAADADLEAALSSKCAVCLDGCEVK